MYNRYRNEGELITICYRNDMVSAGWFEVRLEFERTGRFLSESNPTKSSIIGICRHANGAMGTVFNYKEITCKPSVRSEVEKAFKDYMFRCGIDMRSVVSETHSFIIACGTANPEYLVNFEGIPDKGRVKYSLMFNQQCLDCGYLNIDIKRRGDLVKSAADIIGRYQATARR